ncbi:MAG: N-acetylmuramoyl-L-alanine amidase [bacterium]|nr:N-acetylmuramoyl-L-alanine amidase [bacterium]
MKKIKIGLIVLGSIALVGLVATGMISAQTSLQGKIIALDAGHGGDEVGAQYPANSGTSATIYEKDVNLAVVYALKAKLEGAGAIVVLTRKCDETISSRKSRVDMAIEECKSLGRKCDALVSVHHNGSTNSTDDGLLVIYNERQDKPLAIALHDALWTGLTKPPEPNVYKDEGLDNGGYGMTVYGHLVSALTEAYYITNDWEAQQYLNGTSTQVCSNSDGSAKFVLNGDRVNQEADALYIGLINYFNASPTKPGGKPGGK